MKWLAAIASIVFLISIWYQVYQREFILGHVPEKLMVSNIVYDRQENYGFGPGGNETGVIIYELPEQIAIDIQRNGISYLEKLPLSRKDMSRGQLSWKSTPVRDWDGLSDYLNRYGFGIKIEDRLEQEIDKAIRTPGSFFSKDRIGVLIVIPNTRRVVFAYSG